MPLTAISFGTFQSKNTDPAAIQGTVYLTLINPVITSEGKAYYFLDRSGDGTALNNDKMGKNFCLRNNNRFCKPKKDNLKLSF